MSTEGIGEATAGIGEPAVATDVVDEQPTRSATDRRATQPCCLRADMGG
jgi:hypothetical protein